MSVRRTAVCLVAILSLAGCGGGSDSKAAKDTPPTKADGETAAKAINLVKADLPAGFTSTPHDSSDDAVDADEKAFASCVGASAPGGELVTSYSPDFSKAASPLESQEASSEVDVVSSAATAKQDLAAYKGDKAQSCLTTYVTKALEDETGGGGVTFGTPKVTPLDTPADGIDGGFGYTVALVATAEGAQIPFEVAIQGLLEEHTAVTLTTVSIGKPFPADVRSDLLATIVQRLKDKAV